MVNIRTLNVDDLKKIIEWYDSLEMCDISKSITIETVDTSIGTAIKVYLETKPGEGVWKDFTDYNSW